MGRARTDCLARGHERVLAVLLVARGAVRGHAVDCAREELRGVAGALQVSAGRMRKSESGVRNLVSGFFRQADGF